VLRGFDVLVHEVIAAIITAPSGIKPSVRAFQHHTCNTFFF
jgi:hypothetical protein